MAFPKVIYMTYKVEPPPYVFKRWKDLNPDYIIDFSFDNDCIDFLTSDFGKEIADLFKSIEKGMYKADLWRICKLYVNGGVYADIDLVPHVSIDEFTKDGHTFYSCKCQNGIFQAFIVTTPKNPLLFNFIMSFVKNKPYTYLNGPTFDMFKCLQYNILEKPIISGKVYNIPIVKTHINFGKSDTNVKKINLYNFQNADNSTINISKHSTPDKFSFAIEDNYLIITRTDAKTGWGHNHSLTIDVQSPQSVYLFQEICNSYKNAYVKWNNRKIFDSRDNQYINTRYIAK